MSLASLLQAVRDQIRQETGLTNAECGIQSDGQPEPGFGGFVYVAVHPNGWVPTTGPEQIHALDETYSVAITITKRLSHVPLDRRAEEIFLKSLIGFESLARKIMVAIHQNYDVMERANQYLVANHDTDLDLEGFIETLRWRRTDNVPTPQDGTWFWETREDKVDSIASETLTIVFSGARRIQRKELME